MEPHCSSRNLRRLGAELLLELLLLLAPAHAQRAVDAAELYEALRTPRLHATVSTGAPRRASH